MDKLDIKRAIYEQEVNGSINSRIMVLRKQQPKRLIPCAMLSVASVILLIFGGLFFQQCGSSKTTTSAKVNVTPITYETDIKPMMVAKCTPCYFPETGRKNYFTL